MAARPILALLSLILLAGGILLQLLVILSGTTTHTPISHVYFLEAATASPGARNPSRWTYFAICGVENGRTSNCGSLVPALPFDPPHKSNFGTTEGVPEGFVKDSKYYYYMSRFMWVFYLIALFFAVCALFTGLLALCTRLGAYLSGLNAAVALFFQTITAALMTAWTVKARNTFRHANLESHLGKYAYGFTWAAMACFLLSTVLFCLGGRAGREKGYAKKGAFGRKKSTRSSKSRGSFVDSEPGRGVKDEYA